MTRSLGGTPLLATPWIEPLTSLPIPGDETIILRYELPIAYQGYGTKKVVRHFSSALK
jgi:hypothetical protein